MNLRKRSALFVSAIVATPLTLTALAWNSSAQPDPGSGVPASAGKALRSGWKPVGFSTARSVGTVANQGGGIHHTYHIKNTEYLLQKGSEFITCSTYNHTDTTSGEWDVPSDKCRKVE